MPTSTVTYLGHLRTECTHVKSGQKIITDAPIDNHGKGEAFSPTDLMSTSLVTCMLTIMGIRSEAQKIPFTKAKAFVTKIMTDNPRRVGEIIIDMKIFGTFTPEQKKILEEAALTCPVYLSLHPDLKKTVKFAYVGE